MSATVRAHVDEQMCVGTGMCEATAPELFEVGDDGLSHVLRDDIPAELLDKAREAAENCPTRALTIS